MGPHALTPGRLQLRAIAAGCIVLLGCWGGRTGSVPPSAEWVLPASTENARTGTPTWRISRHSTGHQIEGYALRSTIAPGDSVQVAASVDRTTTVSWSIFRLGHYQGMGARQIGNSGKVTVSPQPPCQPRAPDGLVSCGWAPNVVSWMPRTAPSGAYVLVLSRPDGISSYVPFVVRRPAERGDVLVVLATSTWAAYNLYGGTSLYWDSTKPQVTSAGRAFRVSYDRPFQAQDGTGTLLSNELSAIRWLEAQNLRITYATAEDLDTDPDPLRGASVLVIPGHDEYWTQKRRDRLEAAVDRGLSVLLLSANTGYWRVRLEAAADGRERRVITCFKTSAATEDPAAPQGPLTSQFRQDPLAQPESRLFGVMYTDGLTLPEHAAPMLVRRTDHWAFASTGFVPGDVVWRANGYETDDVVPSSPTDIEILARSPLVSSLRGVAFSSMVLRQTAGGGLVFSVGAVDFVRTLSDPTLADPRAQRLVANVLYRALNRTVPTGLHFFQGAKPSAPILDRVRGATVFAGTPGTPGVIDGAAGVGLLDAPMALAVEASGALLVTDAEAKSVRRVATDGTLSTVSGFPALRAPIAIAADPLGSIWVADGDAAVVLERAPGGTVRALGQRGPSGLVDGPAAVATFEYPAALALSEDGRTLYVGDRDASAIRSIDLTQDSRPVATVTRGQVGHPTALAVAKDGTLYVQDDGSRIFTVRAGKVSLVAGNGTLGYQDGTASGARFIGQAGLALLPTGALLIADPGNYRIRKLEGGKVTTFGGNGRAAPASGQPAPLVLPTGLAVGKDGKVYVAETGNSAIRMLEP